MKKYAGFWRSGEHLLRHVPYLPLHGPGDVVGCQSSETVPPQVGWLGGQGYPTFPKILIRGSPIGRGALGRRRQAATQAESNSLTSMRSQGARSYNTVRWLAVIARDEPPSHVQAARDAVSLATPSRPRGPV